MRTNHSAHNAAAVDPILLTKARTMLDNLRLAHDVETMALQLRELFEVRAPSLERITTPEELAFLIQSIREGIADNRNLIRFIDIAAKVAGLM